MSSFIYKTKLEAPPRVDFDPRNRKHRLDFAQFIKYNKWSDGCRYLLEDPYTNIPDMCKDKLLKHYMRRLMEKI